MSDETHRWITPANVLTVIGILVGAVVGLFGVAFANPTGQRILCNLNSFFCDDVAISSASLSGRMFDLGGWCADYVEALKGMSELDRPPHVGLVPSTADCMVDLSSGEDTSRFIAPLETAQQGAEVVPLVNLSIRHATPLRDVPFTLDLLCGYKPEGAQEQTEIPCDFLRPRVGDVFAGEPLGADEGASPRLALTSRSAYFAQEWRLRINGFETLAPLPAGDYSVSVNIARDGESVAQSEAALVFQIR